MADQKFDYSTVSEAINKLREQGYTLDFNLEKNCIACAGNKYEAEDFDIAHVFRYEGDSDPGDEATVYAIESKSGLKGVLVTGYGASSDSSTSKILEKLHYKTKTPKDESTDIKDDTTNFPTDHDLIV
jgi:hypothetical protein